MIFSNNVADARDVFVGTSNATGWDCYIMTETIHGRYQQKCHVTLKMISDSGSVNYLNYTFWSDGYFKNSQGFEGKVSRHETPIEWNMYMYLWDNG